jgi:hypothetical protein
MDTSFKEDVEQMLAAAAAAPSGDNSQPWRFVVRGKTIEFQYLPEKDNPLLNYEEGGTLIALGAALQNAELEARARGYASRIMLQPSGSSVATMELGADGTLDERSNALREAIFRRHTNRKAYARAPLASDVRSMLTSDGIVGDTAHLSLIEAPEAMRAVARALTTMEEIALGNETLHKLFFEDIFWSDADNRAGRQGLHIKTLELPPPARVLFKVLKHWRVARSLAKIGFPQKVAEMNAAQNASASAFGIITVAQTNRGAYIEVGRLLERVWLLAVSRGLSMQIVTGLTFLARSVNTPTAAELFTADERERIAAAYAIVRQQVEAGQEPILAFRIGTGSAPTEVSYRHPPEVIRAS